MSVYWTIGPLVVEDNPSSVQCNPSLSLVFMKTQGTYHTVVRSILHTLVSFQVCEVYRLHRETFSLASDFLDRFLSSQTHIQKHQLQLIGITSLFIAAKLEVTKY